MAFNSIIKIDGRMGNQMFQWAFARACEAKNGILPLIDDSEETLKLNKFYLMKDLNTVKKPLWNKVLRNIIPFHNIRNKLTKINYDLPIVKEEYFNKFSPNLLTYRENAYYKGFFQTEKYFSDIRNQLLDDFIVNEPLNKQNREMLEQIILTNSVSVHFRRGDYTKKRVSKIFGACSEQYYQNGINIITEKTDKPVTLFIFSDDIEWVKHNINFEQKTVYVDINSDKKGIFDLVLMKNCKHNIIANSSFSWWGAWLNENPEKIVIAPTPWMEKTDNRDLIPQDWIKIKKLR